MHWTAFLAYRRVPANAQVVGNIRCITCGYNLRGLKAMGTCPECGHRVADSLFVKPEVVAAALRGLANSYLTFAILLLGCLGAAWMLIVASALITCGAVFRAWSAWDLKYRAHLINTDLLNSRVRLLWATSLFEALMALLWFAGIIALYYVPSLLIYAQQGSTFLVYGWICAAIINVAAIGTLGLALAHTLGYKWMTVEFKVHRWLVALFAVTTPLPYLTLVMPMSSIAGRLLVGITGLGFLITFASTWMFVHHAANAAEQENETWDELLDSERIAI